MEIPNWGLVPELGFRDSAKAQIGLNHSSPTRGAVSDSGYVEIGLEQDM